MLAGAAKTDITPKVTVWLDGMIREHRSKGVHDPLFARALALSPGDDLAEAIVVVSLDLVELRTEDSRLIRDRAAAVTGVPACRIIVAATHTHSGPATIGYFNPRETAYVDQLIGKIAGLIQNATSYLCPAAVGAASGEERTISHYRRLLGIDGRVVMNWEPFPPERIVGPLGEVDSEVGVLRVVSAEDSGKDLCLLFNHAGHPNVLSGDNCLLSADYPGYAAKLLEEQFGGLAMFVNGALGTADIDGLKDRNWRGVEQAGSALAEAVKEIASQVSHRPDARLRANSRRYFMPARRITDEEYAWAERILAQTGGAVQPMADGVGDDFKALFYRKVREEARREIEIEQICFAVDDCAFISFPGELYTEIGKEIKSRSPFEQTYIIGLANGGVGYIPTEKAIGEGGYSEDMRLVDAPAERIAVEQSCALLRDVHNQQ